MNHTIKGILIVAAITSMLVVGATMIPIMQNSFASKKSDFKKPERDTNTNSNTNTNTNTNSATSDSDSTATATNTNNIDNSATATQNQTQSACAVAVTCPEGSTTVTLALPTPPVSTCNPSTIVGQMATPTDDTCTASSDDLSRTQQEEFAKECESIQGRILNGNVETGFTCTFPSTPST